MDRKKDVTALFRVAMRCLTSASRFLYRHKGEAFALSALSASAWGGPWPLAATSCLMGAGCIAKRIGAGPTGVATAGSAGFLTGVALLATGLFGETLATQEQLHDIAAIKILEEGTEGAVVQHRVVNHAFSWRGEETHGVAVLIRICGGMEVGWAAMVPWTGGAQSAAETTPLLVYEATAKEGSSFVEWGRQEGGLSYQQALTCVVERALKKALNEEKAPKTPSEQERALWGQKHLHL